MIYYLLYSALIGAGLLAVAYTMARVDPGPLRRDFLAFLWSGLAWVLCLYFVQTPGLDQRSAALISSLIFASMELMVIFGLVFAIRLADRNELFRSFAFYALLANNIALVGLAFTPYISQGVKVVESGLAPIHGPAVGYLVISNFVSIAYFTFLLWMGWNIADRRRQFEIEYLGRYSLISFLFIGICNGVLPAFFGNSSLSPIGPIGFLYMYIGLLRLLAKADRLYNHRILEDGMKQCAAFRGGLNLSDNLPEFLHTFFELMNRAGARYRRRVDFAGIGSVYVGTGLPNRRRLDEVGLEELKGLAASFSRAHRENNAFREVYGIAERLTDDWQVADRLISSFELDENQKSISNQRAELARIAFDLAHSREVMRDQLRQLALLLPAEMRDAVVEELVNPAFAESAARTEACLAFVRFVVKFPGDEVWDFLDRMCAMDESELQALLAEIRESADET